MKIPLAPVLFAGSLLWLTVVPPRLHAQEAAAASEPTGSTVPASHAVIVVWDGMRPDCISDEHTPTLARLAREGVNFARHHSVYPSSTEVNGTAMATGCYPGHSTLIGNREYRPAVDPYRSFATEELAALRTADAATGGHYLRVPTLAEALHAAGERTAIASTKPVVILHDRRQRPDAGANLLAESVVLYGGNTLPETAARELEKRLGRPFPREIRLPNVEQDAWTTQALTRGLWRDGLPRLSVLWLSDPDFTQHRYGPLSPQALKALESDDANLGTVLTTLEERGWRASTDVFVVSDHGFSTIGTQVDVASELTKAGVEAVKEFRAEPRVGQLLSVGLGGSVFLYAVQHDPATIQRAVDVLQRSRFAGVVFTREDLPGTFPLRSVHLDAPEAPDIVVALRWEDVNNADGLPGTIYGDGERKPGQGTHATLSRYDLHNTLIANGPSFRRGFRDELPSANTDLAPTITHLLGVSGLDGMDGRVLTEALANPSEPPATAPAAPRTETLRATREEGGWRWEQVLQITRYAGVDYFDEGNAVPAPTAVDPR